MEKYSHFNHLRYKVAAFSKIALFSIALTALVLIIINYVHSQNVKNHSQLFLYRQSMYIGTKISSIQFEAQRALYI